MNSAHAHLIMNHLPVMGIPFGILVVLYGMWRKSDEVKKLGLLVFVFSSLAGAPVYLTGLLAKDQMEKLPGISAGLIDSHQDAAVVSLISAGGLLIAALSGLLTYGRKPRLASIFLWVSLALAFGVSGLFAWTANLGGQIRHPEIRSAAGK